jgi:hypothetical protein
MFLLASSCYLFGLQKMGVLAIQLGVCSQDPAWRPDLFLSELKGAKGKALKYC